MPKTNLISEMTWHELRDVASEQHVLILPVGSTEQHGPHLPLSTDCIIPLGIATEVAKRINGVVAPSIPYGYYSRPKSGGGEDFPGTTSLSSATLIGIVAEVISAYVRNGFRRFLVLNGHYENIAILPEGIEKVETKNDEIRAVVMTWADAISSELLTKLFGEEYPGAQVDHASLTETSLMLYLRPDLVRAELIPDENITRVVNYDIIPAPKDTLTESGSLWSAVGSSGEKGRQLFDHVVNEISKIVLRDLV